MCRIAAVVLAYRRLSLLQECIEALRSQSRPLDEIIVVDQSSGEAISNWLSAQPDLHLIKQVNLGSAGGFGRGIEAACLRGHDWVWIFDEDGIPSSDALGHLVGTPYFGAADTAFLVSNIFTPSGTVQQASVPLAPPCWYGTVLRDDCVAVERASWLGLLINTTAVRTCGLPVYDFFIWHDDQEYTERMSRQLKGYCVLSSVVIHKQSPSAYDAFTPEGSVKMGYAIRNRIAWIKLRSTGVLVRVARVLKVVLAVFIQIYRRQLPVSMLLWIARGLLYRPRIKQLARACR